MARQKMMKVVMYRKTGPSIAATMKTTAAVSPMTMTVPPFRMESDYTTQGVNP